MRKILTGLAAVLLVAVACYGGLVWHNNRAMPAPAAAEIAASHEQSVKWLLNNRARVLRTNNPALWWMIAESARLTGDPRLHDLLAEYRAARAQGRSVWDALFSPELYWGANIEPAQLAGMRDYQQYFLFALTCGRDMAALPSIVAQHDPQFCWKSHPISPACATHQLMGYRFMQRSGCDRVEGLDERVGILQTSITRQLTWDPRVVDVYIQRVLMLVDSGAADRVKPRWLHRVLDAQLPDGGWSALQPLVPLGGGRYFGFIAKFAGTGYVESNFHATAQGVWLTSLLLRSQQSATDPRQAL